MLETLTPNQVRKLMGLPRVSENCLFCGGKILVMCRKGTDVCSENCQKALAIKEAPKQTPIEEKNENA